MWQLPRSFGNGQRFLKKAPKSSPGAPSARRRPGDPPAYVEYPVAYVDYPVAYVGYPVAYVDYPVAYVEYPVAYVDYPVAYVDNPVRYRNLLKSGRRG